MFGLKWAFDMDAGLARACVAQTIAADHLLDHGLDLEALGRLDRPSLKVEAVPRDVTVALVLVVPSLRERVVSDDTLLAGRATLYLDAIIVVDVHRSAGDPQCQMRVRSLGMTREVEEASRIDALLIEMKPQRIAEACIALLPLRNGVLLSTATVGE